MLRTSVSAVAHLVAVFERGDVDQGRSLALRTAERLLEDLVSGRGPAGGKAQHADARTLERAGLEGRQIVGDVRGGIPGRRVGGVRAGDGGEDSRGVDMSAGIGPAVS